MFNQADWHYFSWFFSVQDDLNITSPQVEPLPDNRTIQSFVKDYVEEYMGMNNLTVLFVLICKETFPSVDYFSSF